jgi:hypothetical protein
MGIRAWLRLGTFLLLGLALGQCQTNTTPPASKATAADAAKQAAAKKAAAAKAAAEKAAAEKAADKKTAQAPAGATSTAPTTEAAITSKPVHVVVLAVANDQLSLDVTTLASTICKLDSTCNIHLIVADNLVKDQLKQLNKGDHIQIVYSADAKSQNVLKAWCVDSASPPRSSPISCRGELLSSQPRFFQSQPDHARHFATPYRCSYF